MDGLTDPIGQLQGYRGEPELRPGRISDAFLRLRSHLRASAPLQATLKKPVGRKSYERLTIYSTNRMEAGTESQLKGLGRRKMKGLSVLLAVAAGAWMRLAMLKAIPQVSGEDSLLYGNLAKTLLLHRRFA